jgi:hypothetical protein
MDRQIRLGIAVQVVLAQWDTTSHRSLKIPVVTVLPFHTTWRGCPTLTDSSRMVIVVCPFLVLPLQVGEEGH